MYKYNLKYCKNIKVKKKIGKKKFRWVRQKPSYFRLSNFFEFFCYKFTNKKTGKVTKFGLNTISGSKTMQKKPGSWYKVPPPGVIGLKEIEEGNSCIFIGKKYGVAKDTISHWLKKKQDIRHVSGDRGEQCGNETKKNEVRNLWQVR